YHCHPVTRDLHSFPTRRSSDLGSLTALKLRSHTASPLSTLPKGRRHRGGVVIHNQPAPVGLYIHETVACRDCLRLAVLDVGEGVDRKSTRLNSSHVSISYAVFC